jgi:hypothetical protein
MTGISPPPGFDAAFAMGLVLGAGAGSALPGGPLLGAAPATAFAKLLRGVHGPAAHGAAAGGGPELDPSDGADDALDPAMRHAAHLAPPTQAHGAARASERSPAHLPAPPVDSLPASPPPPVETRAAASLEDLLPALVRRVAWSATGPRGVVHLELGAGSLSGTRLVIEADGGCVRVTIAASASTRSSVDLTGWRDRIAARLAARGIDVGSVELA